MNQSSQSKFSNLVGESRPEPEKHEILGSIAGLVNKVRDRGDSSIKFGAILSTVVMEGVPNNYTRAEVMELLKKIDPTIDETLQYRMVISDTPMTIRGEKAETKQVTFTDLAVTQAFADFVEKGSGDTSIPREICFRNHSDDAHAVEVTMTSEVRNCIKIMEAAACTRRQIEGILLQAIQSALPKGTVNITPVSLRISTTRLENQAAAGGNSRIARRIACSEGRILLFLENATAVSQLLQNQGTFKAGLKLGPMHRVPLLLEAWQSAAASDNDRAERAISKEMEARAAACTTTPNLAAITQVVVRLAPEFAKGVRPRIYALQPAEASVMRALGGIESGILAVQLQADIQNRAMFHGECTIWVGDISRDDRKLSKSLVERLSAGKAAIFKETFEKINIRGKARTECVCDPDTSAVTDDEVAVIIQRSLHSLKNSGFILSAKMTDGQALPLAGNFSGENPLSDLGLALNEGGDRDTP